MKRFWMLISLSFLSMTLLAQGGLAMFEDLYPGCNDNQESPIYGGTYGKWPKELILPEFPGGGDIQLTRFVKDNMEYPEVIDSIEYKNGGKDSVVHLAKGIVAVQVVIDRCGRATRHEVVQSVNELFDAEALRILSGLPTFRPADLNGERVKVALIIPVYFTRSAMPPKEDDMYMDYWGDEDSGDSSSDYDSDSSSDDYNYDDYNYEDW